MKKISAVICCFLCAVLIGTMFSSAPQVYGQGQESGFSAGGKAEASLQQNRDLQLPVLPAASSVFSEEESPDIEEPETETYKIETVQSAGGTLSVKELVTAEEAEAGVTVTVTPDKGYGVSSLLINGKEPGDQAQGPIASGASYIWTIYPDQDIEIQAIFRKSSSFVFLMLDAGHYGKVNRSPVLKSYYESKMTWQLHLYLKQELETYKNVVVDTTRSSQSKDLNVYNRGAASKGYDLFLSLHSNATGSKKADYPLVITQKGKTKDPLAISLGQTIETVMKTKQGYQTWQRLNKDKKTEYYGVLRGSKAVGTKGMILEHSFHTNLNAAKWLSSNANLKKMAEAEAADIAAYYGLSKTGSDIITPSKPSVSVSNPNYHTVNLKWKKSIGATGYVIYRAEKKRGSYKKVKTITKGTTLSYKNTKLTTGKTYYYKVRPYRKVSGKTRYGSYSSIKGVKVRPSKPSVSSRAGKRRITVTWKKVAGASRYVVYRSTKKKGTYKRIATLKNNRRSYTNKNLKKKKRYYYKVKAYRTVKGKKQYSLASNYTTKKAK